VNKLGEAAAAVGVHLKVEYGLLFRQIAEVCREQAFGKAVGWYFGYHQRGRHGGKLFEQPDNLTEGDVERCRHGAVTAVGFE